MLISSEYPRMYFDRGLYTMLMLLLQHYHSHCCCCWIAVIDTVLCELPFSVLLLTTLCIMPYAFIFQLHSLTLVCTWFFWLRKGCKNLNLQYSPLILLDIFMIVKCFTVNSGFLFFVNFFYSEFYMVSMSSDIDLWNPACLLYTSRCV